mmetsp:Transcript_18148/g.41983  ORF Transcript_18148/g.41983 Transcript_18148/m.41983 type:complete len:117 (-) Transcript_18148:87-437(-)
MNGVMMKKQFLYILEVMKKMKHSNNTRVFQHKRREQTRRKRTHYNIKSHAQSPSYQRSSETTVSRNPNWDAADAPDTPNTECQAGWLGSVCVWSLFLSFLWRAGTSHPPPALCTDA